MFYTAYMVSRGARVNGVNSAVNPINPLTLFPGNANFPRSLRRPSLAASRRGQPMSQTHLFFQALGIMCHG